MQYSGAGQQGPRKDTDSCPKKKHDMALHNQSTLQIRKLEKSTLAILDLKTDNFDKFTVDGNAFQTLITRSTKNLPEARCPSGLKQDGKLVLASWTWELVVAR